MRHPDSARSITQRPVARTLRVSLLMIVVMALSACSSLRGDRQADITGDSPDELNWSYSETAKLEAEVAELKSENAELTKRLAEMESAADAEAKSAAASSPAEEKTAAAPAQQPAVKPETVIAAADADRALAQSPAKPVDSSPRLVQPSFASEEETVFENEAESNIKMASVLYGVHLASYRKSDDARVGWRKLQRENPDELGLLEPRIEQVAISGKGDFLRLIAGGFASQAKAAALCETLKSKGIYCAVTSFEGEKLSLGDAG